MKKSPQRFYITYSELDQLRSEGRIIVRDKLTKRDIEKIVGSEVKGYNIEAARIKNGPFIDSDHYGIVLGKNAKGNYVTWHFHLLDDESISVYWGHYFMADRDAAIRDFNKRSQGV